MAKNNQRIDPPVVRRGVVTDGPSSNRTRYYHDPWSTFGRDYGDIYGPRYTGDQVTTVGPEEEEPVVEEEERRRSQGPRFMSVNLPEIDFNEEDYQPTTREVQDEELVENRLTDLLASDSRYIQQARRRGERAAASRGALSSSIFAGASEASAIQAALPIAQQDAQTYFRTAAENMAAKNNMTLAKLQSATAIAQSQIGASATLGAASISANARMAIKEMDNEIRKDLFHLGAEHDSFMEQLRQEGRIELTELNYYQQRQLEQLGFEHTVELSELSHSQRKEIEETFNDPRFYANLGLQRTNSMANMFMSMAGMYANGINSMNMADIDESAFARGESFYSQMFQFMFDFNNQLWGGGFPDISIGGSGDNPGNVGPQEPGGG